MNYFHEVVTKAAELGLTRYDKKYDDYLLRTTVYETTFYDGHNNEIARMKGFSELPHDTEQSAKRALQALEDYASWK